MKGIAVAKKMTTKEVAEALQTTKKTVLENAKKCLPGKVYIHGQTTYWNEEEVTVLLECMKNNAKGQGARNDLAVTEVVTVAETSLTPALNAKQFLSKLNASDKNTQSVIISTVAQLNSMLIEALQNENSTLTKENKQLKHQVEYNAVIGCSRWNEVKKLIGIRDNWDIVSCKLGLEEGVDFYRKCMGDDKYPTTMITDGAVERIKDLYKFGC